MGIFIFRSDVVTKKDAISNWSAIKKDTTVQIFTAEGVMLI